MYSKIIPILVLCFPFYLSSFVYEIFKASDEGVCQRRFSDVMYECYFPNNEWKVMLNKPRLKHSDVLMEIKLQINFRCKKAGDYRLELFVDDNFKSSIKESGNDRDNWIDYTHVLSSTNDQFSLSILVNNELGDMGTMFDYCRLEVNVQEPFINKKSLVQNLNMVLKSIEKDYNSKKLGEKNMRLISALKILKNANGYLQRSMKLDQYEEIYNSKEILSDLIFTVINESSSNLSNIKKTSLLELITKLQTLDEPRGIDEKYIENMFNSIDNDDEFPEVIEMLSTHIDTNTKKDTLDKIHKELVESCYKLQELKEYIEEGINESLFQSVEEADQEICYGNIFKGASNDM